MQKRRIVFTRPGQSNFGQAVPSPVQGKVLYASNENDVYGQKSGGQGSTGNSTGAHIHINADPSVIKRWFAD